MVLSVVLCLLASSLIAFFLYPRSVVVADDGIHAVIVRFDHSNKRVQMDMTVGFPLPPCSSQHAAASSVIVWCKKSCLIDSLFQVSCLD